MYLNVVVSRTGGPAPCACLEAGLGIGSLTGGAVCTSDAADEGSMVFALATSGGGGWYASMIMGQSLILRVETRLDINRRC